MRYASFDDYLTQHAPASFATVRRGGGAHGVRLISVAAPAHGGLDPATPDLVVGLVTGGRARAEWAWDGATPNRTRCRVPGTLGLTPPDTAGRFEVDGASTMLLVTLPLARLSARLADEVALPRDFGFLHDRYSAQPVARDLCLRLWRAARHEGRAAHDLIDALAEALVAELAGVAAGVAGQLPAGGLSAATWRRVLARAEDEECDVPALALAAAMPVRSFRRAFERTAGLPPHRWLMGRRLERARRLVEAGRLPLAEIAHATGFASQAHLTSCFTARWGVTPGRLRRRPD